MAVDIKQAYRRLIEEAFGKGNLEVFDEVCGAGYKAHDPLTGDADMDQQKEMCRGYRTAFPDLTASILASHTDGDTVFVHWRMTGMHQKPLMGIQPTGKRCTVEGMSLGRFRGGKLVEEWAQWDALGLMRQLGVAPSIQPGTGATRAQERPHA
jgi:predicted ester cyclase